MATERRNLYRLLYVQPEAPPEVIKAAFRALMSTLRMHPDLGGDTETAARLNAAYEVLGDPQRRHEYDQRQRRSPRGRAAAAHDPATWLAERRCPYCGAPFALRSLAGARCDQCDSPLTPAPADDPTAAAAELLGRRGSTRVPRLLPARVTQPDAAPEPGAQVQDLSLTGLSLHLAAAVPKGRPLRVLTALFDGVAQVVASRRTGSGVTVHARLLTLQVRQPPRGVIVDLSA